MIKKLFNEKISLDLEKKCIHSHSLKAQSGRTGGRVQFSNYDKQITYMADMQ